MFESLDKGGAPAVMMAVSACAAVRNAENASNGRMKEACRKFGHAMKGLECDVDARAYVAMSMLSIFGDPTGTNF